MNLNGELIAFDMDSSLPHLISGTTGSGKSSLLRAILLTLIQSKQPNELRLILGDLKRAEFGIYRNVPHVDGVYVDQKTLKIALGNLVKEMNRREDLIDKHDVNHVRELKEKLPYVVLVIDEVATLDGDKVAFSNLLDLSNKGRALGIFIILSVLRPDSKMLDGRLKNASKSWS